MHFGINIGNDLETDGMCGSKTCSNVKLCKSNPIHWENFGSKLPKDFTSLVAYFKVYKDSGLDTVRIPVRWGHHVTDENSREPIDLLWLARVNMVLGAALENDLKVLVNSHHDNYLICKSFHMNWPQKL